MTKSIADQPIIVKSEMGKFISIPVAVDDAELTLIEFRVYVNLARRAGNEDGLAYPSYARIARDCFRSTYATASDATLRRMAMTAIAGLVEKGMLTKHSQMRENGSASSNIYTLTLPSKWTTNQPGIPESPPPPEPAQPEPNTIEGDGAYAPPPESTNLGGGVVHMHQGGAYAPLEEDPIEEVKATTTTDTSASAYGAAGEVNQTATTTITPTTATAAQTMTDPAMMYVTAFGRTLTSAERKMVYQRVTNLPLWEQSLEFWKKENNAPTAVKRLLSTYEIYQKLAAGQQDPKPNVKIVDPPKPDYRLFDPRKFRETGLCAPGTGVTPYEIYREVTRNELSFGVINLIHDEIKPDTFNAWRNTVTFWSNSGYRMNNIHGMLKNYYDQLGRAQPPPRGTNGWAAAASQQGRGNDNQTNIEPVSAERAQLLAEIEAELAAQQSAGAR